MCQILIEYLGCFSGYYSIFQYYSIYAKKKGRMGLAILACIVKQTRNFSFLNLIMTPYEYRFLITHSLGKDKNEICSFSLLFLL